MSPSVGELTAPVRLSCLGPVAVTAPDGTRITLRTRKQTALLVVLAHRVGQPLLRDQALDLLWSEDDERAARHSLSQSVSLINKSLGREAVSVEGKTQLVLRPGAVALDVAEFEDHVAAGRHAEARAVWRGNLLDGFRVRRAPGFERWAEQERQRLARLMRGVLHAEVAVERAAGDWLAMRRTTEALLALDHFDEEATAAHLEALALLGDRGQALRRYREFEQLLRDELDAEPGPVLRAWAQRQRRGDALAHTAGPMLVRETPVAPQVFGRHEEFATLWERWEAARQGAGSFLLLRGAAGIGKSALAAKLANQVHVGGGATVLVRCFRSEKPVPFAPISALVRQLARLPGFLALDAVWIGELSRLAPELRERFADLPAPMAIDDSARARLCDATLHAAECVADEQPVLIVVDDLPDADEATLALLHYFGRMAGDKATFLLGIARTPPGDVEFERSFVDTAQAAGFVRTLELGALPGDEVRRIVQQVLAHRGLDAPAATVELVAGVAKGNPLAAIELSAALPVDGGPTAQSWLTGLTAGTGGGVESFEHTAADRFARLPEHARTVAATLALAGRPLSDYDLAAVTGLPASTLASAILALETGQFIRRSAGNLAFSHERYRDSTEAAVRTEDRRRLHGALAAFVARSAAENPAARYEAAYHFAEAGRRRDARAHALAAARFAASVGAVRERASALELARRVSARYDGRLAADLGSCLLDLKEFDRLDALCAEARRARRLDPHLADEFRFLEIAADYYAGRAPLRRVQASLEALLAELKPGFPKLVAVRYLLMTTADKTGDHLVVKRVARAMRREPAPEGRRRSAHELYASAYAFAKYYWPRNALPLLEEALHLAQEERDWELERVCREGLGNVLLFLGRYDEAMSEFQFSLALAKKTLNPLAEAMVLNNIAVVQLAKGEFVEAAGAMGEAAKIDAGFPHWPLRLFRYHNRGILSLLTGDYEAAEADLRLSLEEALNVGLWQIGVNSCGGLGVCAARRGDYGCLLATSRELERITAGRLPAVAERWAPETTVAWSAAIGGGASWELTCRVEHTLHELRRRNIDHWLRLRLEWIQLQEHLRGSRLYAERSELAADSRTYGANAIERDASR